MVGRFGYTELLAMLRIEKFLSITPAERAFEFIQQKRLTLWRDQDWEPLEILSGFFPVNQANLVRFLHEMQASVPELDLFASWTAPESRYTGIRPDLPACELRQIEPYFHDTPWSGELKGRKVLVVHPFAKLIEEQYHNKRLLLFPGKNVLPECELKTLQAVQTAAKERDSRFSSWFEALDWMEQQALASGCDVILIGCGAYGFPLAARLKRLGKQTIHLGGALQLLFGIKGKRWDAWPETSAFYNEHWIRATGAERPAKADLIEGSCYW